MCETIKKMISENDVILLDTSVAMDENFGNLVEAMEMILLEKRKKIIVKSVVWSELLKHLGSADVVKQKRATRAVELIGIHRNIFNIEDTQVSKDQIKKSFADAQFLAELTLNKSKCKQVLLTNDKKLSCDANNLNNQESCLGKQISIYKLDPEGNLTRYKDVQDEVEVKFESNELEESEMVRAKDGCKGKKVVKVSIFSFATGFIVGKYGKNFAKYIMKTFA